MILDFLSKNWIEIAGVILSLLYLFFSIKEKVLLWPFGILSALFYIAIYFQSKFYADMGLQFYYLFISIYGWIIWTRPADNNQGKKVKVSRVKGKLWLFLSAAVIGLWIALYLVLRYLTDSEIPGWDALTTAASVVATWMLAKKYLEHWLFWIVIDLLSMCLYIYKGLYPTSVLFAVYTIMALVGFRSWRKGILAY